MTCHDETTMRSGQLYRKGFSSSLGTLCRQHNFTNNTKSSTKEHYESIITDYTTHSSLLYEYIQTPHTSKIPQPLRYPGHQTHTNPVSYQSKQSRAEENRANLPLPEDPPAESDFNSMDQSTVNVGSGRVESHAGTGPHSTTGQQALNTKQAQADMSKIGREGKENLDGPPKDASY